MISSWIDWFIEINIFWVQLFLKSGFAGFYFVIYDN